MPKPERISSAANPLLKEVRRAIVRGARTASGLAVAETFHLLEEALRSECGVETVLAAESVMGAAETHVRGLKGVRVAVLPDPLFERLSGTESSQGVMALVRMPEWKLEQLFRGRPLVVALDGLQDPGNAGTIARTAEAFGASGMMFLKGTASPFHPKTLRAAAGSLFRIPFLHGLDPALARAALRQHGEVYAGVPASAGNGARPIDTVDLTRRCSIVIGSEARGVSAEMRGAALDVSIPTVGVESLNAAAAAAVMLYEARRQRAARP